MDVPVSNSASLYGDDTGNFEELGIPYNAMYGNRDDGIIAWESGLESGSACIAPSWTQSDLVSIMMATKRTCSDVYISQRLDPSNRDC